MPMHTLETITTRLVLPTVHINKQYNNVELPSKSMLTATKHPLKSMNDIPLLQIKKGGASFKPKQLLSKCKTLKKVLRTALILGKSLWQQARIEDAATLMSHAIVRAIECLPTRDVRTAAEDIVRVDLFRAAKRAKLVGRRDPAMSVMLIRSVFSNSLLRILGKKIDEEIDLEQPLVLNKNVKQSRRKGSDGGDGGNGGDGGDKGMHLQMNLNQELLISNTVLVEEAKETKRQKLEKKEKKEQEKIEYKKRIQKEERRTRQQERIDAKRYRLQAKEELDDQAEKDEDRWYAEGKRLEEVRMDLEKKEREATKKKKDKEKKKRKASSFKKRKAVEAARIKSIEDRAARKSKGIKVDNTDGGFKDGRDVDWGRRVRGTR